eukprot:TRINITY_DN2061_c0_g1_i6.p1 TRINITY_DN2061_c0_g1~~TRINITY_DN2061_c0_g1_i6.p1  ORF type:complete len:434 (-),score=77.80 TRINITY_DN2061_c0_g1_i6:233-1498(-)
MPIAMKRPVFALLVTLALCGVDSFVSAKKVHSQTSAMNTQDTDPMFVEPEGGTPVTPVGKARWSATSSVPEWLQLFFAFSWIGLVGSIPIIIRKLTGTKPQTKTQMGLSVGLWVTLFGGLYLFTNVILFQSAHFDTVRPLTVVECIYLMSQMITTVGYGDITPAKPRGQVFIGLYVIGSLFVISMFISQLSEHLAKVAADYEEKLREKMLENATRAASENAEEHASENAVGDFLQPPVPDKSKFLKAMAMFLVLDIIFVAFFCLWPGEGKTLLQAIYMSIITLSTVGFGAFTPVTESGMIFGAFMMLFGSAALVNVVGAFTELMMQSHAYELREEHTQEALQKLKENTWGGDEGKDQVSDIEFLRFALISQNLLKDREVENIMKAFQSLRPVNGKIPLAVLEAAVKHDKDHQESAESLAGK